MTSHAAVEGAKFHISRRFVAVGVLGTMLIAITTMVGNAPATALAATNYSVVTNGMRSHRRS